MEGAAGELHLVPINTLDSDFLSRLAFCLEERFLYRCLAERALEVPRSVLNPLRNQMFVSALITRVHEAYRDGGLVLAITDFDLYTTEQRFAFGAADEHDGIALVSRYRLRAERYSEPPDENALFQRVLKEAVHQLGHALSLNHCYNVRCAMYFSSSIFETDNKTSQLCDICDRRLESRTRAA